MRLIERAHLLAVLVAWCGVASAGGPGAECGVILLDGFETGDFCRWEGTCPVPFPDPSASLQIQDARNAPDGAVSIAVTGALVTYTKETIGSDPAGFFLQAELEGPALFVAVDPASLSPVPVPGDVVSLTVTEMGTATGLRQATAIADWLSLASGAPLSCYVQDVSAALDLVSGLDGYESELVSLVGLVAGAFGSAGPAFESAQLETSVIVGESDLRLRVPTSVKDALDLAEGCEIELVGSPLWRFVDQAQLSAWRTSDLLVLSCPEPPPVVTAGNLGVSGCTGSSDQSDQEVPGAR